MHCLCHIQFGGNLRYLSDYHNMKFVYNIMFKAQSARTYSTFTFRFE